LLPWKESGAIDSPQRARVVIRIGIRLIDPAIGSFLQNITTDQCPTHSHKLAHIYSRPDIHVGPRFLFNGHLPCRTWPKIIQMLTGHGQISFHCPCSNQGHVISDASRLQLLSACPAGRPQVYIDRSYRTELVSYAMRRSLPLLSCSSSVWVGSHRKKLHSSWQRGVLRTAL
jgi:hypothetical protein